MAKRILVNGSGGFIGGHLVKRLKAEGYWVEPEDTHWDGEIYREVCAPWCHDSATGWALTVKPIRCGI
jgi:hypothetical protein